MKIKVEHAELKNVEKEIIEASTDLTSEIELWINNIEALGTIWQGIDAEVFRNKSLIYMEKLLDIPECYNEMASFISNSNKLYQESDENFKNDFVREAKENE